MDQTIQLRGLIKIFTGCTYDKVFLMVCQIFKQLSIYKLIDESTDPLFVNQIMAQKIL